MWSVSTLCYNIRRGKILWGNVPASTASVDNHKRVRANLCCYQGVDYLLTVPTSRTTNSPTKCIVVTATNCGWCVKMKLRLDIYSLHNLDQTREGIPVLVLNTPDLQNIPLGFEIFPSCLKYQNGHWQHLENTSSKDFLLGHNLLPLGNITAPLSTGRDIHYSELTETTAPQACYCAECTSREQTDRRTERT